MRVKVFANERNTFTNEGDFPRQTFNPQIPDYKRHLAGHCFSLFAHYIGQKKNLLTLFFVDTNLDEESKDIGKKIEFFYASRDEKVLLWHKKV